MKRTYTVTDLRSASDTMRNYVVDLKYFGAKTTLKVHVGTVGNHLEIIERIAKEHYGNKVQVVGARVTGKPWSSVSPFSRL